MLPPDQQAVLRSIYEWCYVGRPSLMPSVGIRDLPSDFQDAARAIDRLAAGSLHEVPFPLPAVPEHMLAAEFGWQPARLGGTLHALKDRGYLQVVTNRVAFSGSWKLPDGRRLTVHFRVRSPAETNSRCADFEWLYGIEGRFSSYSCLATCSPLSFRLTPDGIVAAEQWNERTANNHGSGEHAATPPALPELGPHDRQAYQMSLLDGWTQEEIAAELNRQHGTKYKQGQISRLIKRAKRHAEASGLADLIPKPAKPAQSIDPQRLEVGKRRDHRTRNQRDRRTSTGE